MEMTKEDYRELYNFSERSSSVGERARDWLDRKLHYVTRKTIIIGSCIVLGVGFFIIGFIGRKKNERIS